MSFEPASENDLDAVMAIERTPGYEWFIGRPEREEHLALMRSSDALHLLWREGGAVAGCVLLTRLDTGHVAHARTIALARPGEGVGRRFVPALIDWVFGQTPAHRFELHTSAENTRAIRVYEREGFVREGVFREVFKAPDGRFVSALGMSILRPEWEVLRASSPPSG